MTELRAALSWSGVDVTLSLFVVWSSGGTHQIPPPPTTTQPRVVRSYDLEDEGNTLGGRSTSELDLIFDEVPADLDDLLEAWLTSSVRAGGAVAWFGFEGSFDFDHILTADVADQVYGVAGPDFVALATDDRRRASGSWVDQLRTARRAVFHHP